MLPVAYTDCLFPAAHVPPSYEGDDETIITTNLPAAARQFLTYAGLLAPGDRSLFKVYTINENGNEKGSNAVDITYPTL